MISRKEVEDLIYEVSGALSVEEKRSKALSALSLVSTPVTHDAVKGADPEVLEGIVQDIIEKLVSLLRAIDAGEKSSESKSKEVELDGNDNVVLPIDNSPLVPPSPGEPNTLVGTIDPNATGIPDNARKSAPKTMDADLMEQLDHPNFPTYSDMDTEKYPTVYSGDESQISSSDEVAGSKDLGNTPPHTLDQFYPVKVGDFVSWASPLGRSFGQVESIVFAGQVNIPDSGNSLAMIATEEDPVCQTRIYRNDSGEGWSKTDTVTSLKMSALYRIDPLEGPRALPPVLPNSRSNSYSAPECQKILNRKGLGHFKALDNGTVSVVKNFQIGKAEVQKDINSVSLGSGGSRKSSFDITGEDRALLGSDWIPDGSICCDVVAADSDVDRGNEQFLSPSLDQLALLYKGMPLLLDHDWSARNIVGKILSGRNDSGELVLRAFVPNTDANKWVVDAIKSGIFCKVSVGFASSPDCMLCSVCKISMSSETCPHQPGETTPLGTPVVLQYSGVSDVYEVSIVGVPMQRNARIKGVHSLLDSILPTTEKRLLDRISSETNTKGTVELSTKEVTPAEKENLMPQTAVDPQSAGTLDDPVVPGTAKSAEDMPKENPGEEPGMNKGFGAMHDKMDAHSKMIGEVHQAHENLKNDVAKMFGTLQQVHDTCGDIGRKLEDVHSKCDAMHGLMKSFSGASESIQKELTTNKEENDAILVKFAQALVEIHKMLEVGMSVSTETIRKQLSQDNLARENALQKSTKYWVQEVFGSDNNDSGGQQ